MKNKFNIVEGFVPATPRSQRKKNATAGGGSTIVVEGSGEGNSSLDPNSHTHTNLPLLESLADQDGYLTRKEVNPDTAEDADPFVYTKVNAGFADKSGDSEKWNGNPFADFLDQPVRREDAVEHKSVTVSESVASKDFRQGGFSGSGFGLYFDANNNAVAEVDILKARKEVVFNTAVINQVTFQVGATVFSNGGCEIARVEELDDVYRCYYDTKEGRRLCGLVVEDQARCQQYDPSQNRIVKYYWRLVVAVGEDYVDLSKTDVDGTGVPEAGDEIAQFGHRTDKTRQGATIIDPKDGSSVVVYSEINSYSLDKKNFVGLGTNPQTGRPYLYCYGDFFLGDRELKNQFLTFQIPEGQEVPQLIGELNIKLGAGSSGLTNLTEWADKQQQIDDAANAQFSSINLIDDSKTRTSTASADSKNEHLTLPIGAVTNGEKFALSIGSITNLAGNPSEYTAVIYGTGSVYELSNTVLITQQNRTAVFVVNKTYTNARLLVYAGKNGETAGNSVRFDNLMLIRGNKPCMTWAPSVNDQKQAAIDGVQVGGVNLLDGSETLETWSKNGSYTNLRYEEYQGYKCAVITNTVGTYAGVFKNVANLNIGGEYTSSLWVFAEQETVIYYGLTSTKYTIQGDEIGKWIRVSKLQKPSSASTAFLCYATLTDASQKVAFRMTQLEEGNKVTSWLPSIKDQKQAAIDGVQVGGVNLLDNSATLSSPTWLTYNYTRVEDEVDGYKCLVNKAGEGGVFISTSINTSYIFPGQKYISSVWVHGTSTKCYIRFGIEGETGYGNRYLTESELNKWVRFVGSVQTAGATPRAVACYFGVEGGSSSGSDFMAVRNIQMENGSKETTWAPSPADVQAEIDKVQQAVSDLDYLKGVFPNAMLDVNGVVLAQLLGVKSSTAADAAIVAGFYGGSDEALNKAGFKDPTHGILMMFAGAESVQSVANAKTRVYGDGSIFTQMLYADGGKIGGFTIQGSSLQAGASGADSLYLSSSLLEFAAGNYTGRVLVGSNVMPGISGMKGLMRMELEGDVGTLMYTKATKVGGLSIDRMRSWTNYGDLFSVGSKVFASDKFRGTVYTDTIELNFDQTDTFIFSYSANSGTTMAVNLPSLSDIESKFGSRYVTFKLTLLCERSFSGTIRITAPLSAPLLNNSGNVMNGGDGYVDMGRGDVIVLQYATGYYYFVSRMS